MKNSLQLKLNKEYYQNPNVVQVAQDLLGKVLCTHLEGVERKAIITETEAYEGSIDKASHAYGNRRTARTEIMFGPGGTAYVYLCYGIHHLFNVVTGPENLPHAVLIRALLPLEGLEWIALARGKYAGKRPLMGGPGTVSQGMGIKTQHTGLSLTGNKIWIEDHNIVFTPNLINKGPRIGVGYAGEHANWPYRFWIKNSDLLEFEK